MLLTRESVRYAALGGSFLGGGGGGSISDGISLGELALEVGGPRIVALEELDSDAPIATVSAVGAPAAKAAFLKPADYVVALQELNRRLETPVAGLISSENGGIGTLNGWFQSAMTGIPVVDAACDGRAHPTGVMGSMGLDTLEEYRSVQAVAGGDPAAGKRVVVTAEGDMGAVDRLVRQAAVEAGGMIAVARNPVSASYVKDNGAPGAIGLAIELGALMEQRRGDGGRAVAEALASRLNGEFLAEGEVAGYTIRTTGGYDVGRLAVREVSLTFWNEYMSADREGGRLATFPDLIATLDAETGTPVTTAEISTGRRVIILVVPKERLLLGAGVRRAEALEPVEEVLDIEMVKHFGDSGVSGLRS
jgi:DUF917 family protein